MRAQQVREQYGDVRRTEIIETESGELKLRGDRTRVRLTAAPRQMASVLVAW